MSRGLKIILHFIVWLAVISYVAVATWYHSSMEKQYSGLEVRILDNQKFVDADIVASLVDSLVSGQEGKPFNEISLQKIEQVIGSHPYVQNVEVFSDIEGHCIVELSQRDVIFRVVSQQGHDFFVDTLGYMLNPSGVWQKDVPIITTDCKFPFQIHQYGYIDTCFQSVSNYYLKNLRNFVEILNGDKFLNGLITQTRITGELEPGKESIHLVPRIGKQRIILGNFSELKDKMENVNVFYCNTFKDGWSQNATEICFQYGDKVIIKRDK